jgi:hypothetical protein
MPVSGVVSGGTVVVGTVVVVGAVVVVDEDVEDELVVVVGDDAGVAK